MLTTEDIMSINLDSNSNNIDEHEDFLQQLSMELDIPMLLDQNGPVLNFDNSEDDLLSEVTTDTHWQCDTLDHIDFTYMEPIQMPAIKLEPCIPSSPESLYTDSILSHSPTPSQSSDGSQCSIEIKAENTNSVGFDTPPVSPQEKSKPESFICAENFVQQHSVSNINKCTKIHIKRVPIQPRPHNITPVKNKRKLMPSENFINEGKTQPVITSLKLNNASSGKVVVLENVPVQLTNMPLLYTNDSESNFISISSDMDAKVLKRQQRMIKNRESACLSRKKKKDYLMSLEKEVADLKLENHKLKQENAQLRDRLFGKTKGISLTLPTKPSKNSVFLLVVLFMVTINVGSIRGIFNYNNPQSTLTEDISTIDQRHGRNLLWAPMHQIEPAETPVGLNISSDLPVCPKIYVNQTESVRLAQELHRWIAKPYNVSTVVKSKRNRKYIKYNPRSEIRVPSYRASRKLRRLPQTDNELQVFKPRPEAIYSEFFEAIHRRDDTFYVVSFNADNMLLPALHHNNTRRPKMSLLLPAMLPNETNSDRRNFISLMQIDCEVIDTRLLHVKSNSIPQHLRSASNEDISPVNNNVTSPSASDDSVNKLYKPYFLKNGAIVDRVYSEKAKKLFKFN